MKNIIIYFIHLYQKYAPQDLRNSCRFEPTCSNYMIMAIYKYGTIKGCFYGMKRLIRCRYPNGGYDFP